MKLVLREMVGENLGSMEDFVDLADKLNDEAGEELYTGDELNDCLIGLAPVAPQFFHHLSSALSLTPTEVERVIGAWRDLPHPTTGAVPDSILDGWPDTKVLGVGVFRGGATQGEPSRE